MHGGLIADCKIQKLALKRDIKHCIFYLSRRVGRPVMARRVAKPIGVLNRCLKGRACYLEVDNLMG
jgi:hypothetical protein